MAAISRQVGIWSARGQRPSADTLALAAEAGARGGRKAAAQWRSAHPEAAAGYAHGEQDDLWWEFDLIASFRWQAHVGRLNPAFAEQRLLRLAGLFGLTDLLHQPVAALTTAERSRANLAVALFTQPDLLIWEEPFRAMPGREWMQLCRLVRRLCRTEGLTVIMVAEQKEDLTHVAHYPHRSDHPLYIARHGSARRRAAAAGALWP